MCIDLPMRIGDAVIRMAGIGDVYTEREHRMKGYMRYLYEDTLTYMTEEGYDVSMLFGIPDFYTKFGYAVCLPQCHLHDQDA
jgi:predicted acetyltransferase